MFKDFAIEYIDTAEFDSRMTKTVRNHRLQHDAKADPDNNTPLDATLLRLRQAPYACQTVVFEYEYVDQDYQSEFSVFYSKAFKNYPHRCLRLHFFRVKIPQTEKMNFKQYAANDGYLGFIVIRPIDLQQMGRTVLVPAITDKHREFVHCKACFRSYILGEELHVTGMPFTQQDTQVGACAQASLWMLARYMSHRFGHREFLPAEINQLAKATISMGRPLPAERGLNDLQMLDALQGMGFSPLNYALMAVDDCSPHIEKAFSVDPNAADVEVQRLVQRLAKLADITYRYIESGLPVIISTSNHALVGVGHTYDHSPVPITPPAISTAAIQRIPAFVVNNDNSGPYLEMPLFTISNKHLSFLEVESIIAVLPPEVTLRGEEAEVRARTCIEQFLQLKPDNKVTFADIIGKLRPNLAGNLAHLEYRTYLRLSVEFQSNLRDDIQGDAQTRRFDPALGEELIRIDYPKYIWITEISSADLLNKPQREARECLGRVIIDSTAPANTECEMVVHFADFLQLHNRQTCESTWSHRPDTTPFAHKVLAV